MMSFFKSISKSENAVEGNSPPSMNATVHSCKEFSDMNNLSTTSLAGALNLVGMDIQNSVVNMQQIIKKDLH